MKIEFVPFSERRKSPVSVQGHRSKADNTNLLKGQGQDVPSILLLSFRDDTAIPAIVVAAEWDSFFRLFDKDGAAPNQVIQVDPTEWRHMWNQNGGSTETTLTRTAAANQSHVQHKKKMRRLNSNQCMIYSTPFHQWSPVVSYNISSTIHRKKMYTLQHYNLQPRQRHAHIRSVINTRDTGWGRLKEYKLLPVKQFPIR